MRANYAKKDEVFAVPIQQETETWKPVHHKAVIQALDTGLNDMGVNVMGRDYQLSPDGLNLFGTCRLDLPTITGTTKTLGFRNSMDKSFALGFTSGLHVVVCSNMQFSGDFLEFRRHTKGLTLDEIYRMIGAVLDQIVNQADHFSRWIESLKETVLIGGDFKTLTFDAMRNGVFPPSKFNNFIDCYEMETRQSGDKTLYEFNGGVTRLFRDVNNFTVAGRSRNLKNTIDDFRANQSDLLPMII